MLFNQQVFSIYQVELLGQTRTDNLCANREEVLLPMKVNSAPYSVAWAELSSCVVGAASALLFEYTAVVSMVAHRPYVPSRLRLCLVAELTAEAETDNVSRNLLDCAVTR